MINLKNISQSGDIQVWFPEHPLWIAADIVTVCTVLSCIVVVARGILKKRIR